MIGSQNDGRTLPVWDIFVRGFHWTIVAGFFVAYFSEGDPVTLHAWAGYIIAIAVVARIAWGFVGPTHARFSDFVVAPGRALSHLLQELHFRAPRYVGHSPAGGLMVIVLLCALLATATSGMTLLALHEGKGPFASFFTKLPEPASPASPDAIAATEQPAKKENPTIAMLEEVHGFIANASLFLVVFHVAGVLLASLGHRENLTAAMIDGRKRPPA